MLDRILKWFRKRIIKTPYILGVDISSGKDYSCEVESYVDKEGRQIITSVRYYSNDEK